MQIKKNFFYLYYRQKLSCDSNKLYDGATCNEISRRHDYYPLDVHDWRQSALASGRERWFVCNVVKSNTAHENGVVRWYNAVIIIA